MVSRGRTDFVMNAVVGLRLGGCASAVGDKYIDGALATAGALLHVCDNDWGEVIDVIFDATVTRLQASFLLSRRPDPETLRVFVFVGEREEEGLVELLTGWRWEDAANSVIFEPALERGKRVLVRYFAGD